jgi:hypothetical protein
MPAYQQAAAVIRATDRCTRKRGRTEGIALDCRRHEVSEAALARACRDPRRARPSAALPSAGWAWGRWRDASASFAHTPECHDASRLRPTWPWLTSAAGTGGVGLVTTSAGSLDAGVRRRAQAAAGAGARLVSCLKTLFVPGHQGLGGSFFVCSAATGCRPPGHLGTGPCLTPVTLHHLWPALNARPPRTLRGACDSPRVNSG